MDVCHCTVNGEGPTEAVGERKDAGTNFPVRRSLGTRCAPAGTAPLTVHSAHAAESACACCMCACQPGINPSFSLELWDTYTSAPGSSCPLGGVGGVQ